MKKKEKNECKKRINKKEIIKKKDKTKIMNKEKG